ncbi:hypothetical protein AMEX_G16055 [Astyanax mexicanus]|uniref:Immunoglobulin V-set domain-containing protein n=1 Tax=Astyanax mexicanus TaxID=7994 RepID=A0A8T2LE17_ASTMX|nr:hypothetical protein AMEX_G16055 [Astyanax mexicanus]
MRVFYLLLFSQAVSAQLQCDKTIIRATIGRTLNLACTFHANRYRFSRKYWCAGESRSTCEILMDTDGFTKAQLRSRARIAETGFKNFHIQITGLQLSDTGVYWVGIEKDYADIMVKIQLEVTEGKDLCSQLHKKKTLFYICLYIMSNGPIEMLQKWSNRNAPKLKKNLDLIFKYLLH